MITEKELREAIAECQGTRNPNANTCLKLASYYTILDHLLNKEDVPEVVEIPAYSYENREEYSSSTDFGRAIAGQSYLEVMEVMDELMTTLQVINPRLYASVMRKFGQ